MSTVDWEALDRLTAARRAANAPTPWVPGLFDRWDSTMTARVAAYDAECESLDEPEDDEGGSAGERV